MTRQAHTPVLRIEDDEAGGFALSLAVAEDAASGPVWAWTCEMSRRPNSCWIVAPCGSGDAGVATPRAAASWIALPSWAVPAGAPAKRLCTAGIGAADTACGASASVSVRLPGTAELGMSSRDVHVLAPGLR